MKNVYLLKKIQKKSFLIVKKALINNIFHPVIDILSMFMVAKVTFLS